MVGKDQNNNHRVNKKTKRFNFNKRSRRRKEQVNKKTPTLTISLYNALKTLLKIHK